MIFNDFFFERFVGPWDNNIRTCEEIMPHYIIFVSKQEILLIVINAIARWVQYVIDFVLKSADVGLTAPNA